MNPPNAYIICSNPRSATTLLCDMLLQTGVAGTPDSFFRQQSIGWWASEWGLNKAATEFRAKYLEAMLTEGQNGGSVFGI